MPDNWEQNYGGTIWMLGNTTYILNPIDGTDAEEDPDSDTMTNIEEYLYGKGLNGKTLNPRNIDTDNDKMNDSYEVQYGLDPLDITDGGDTDTDGDGLDNVYEYCLNVEGIPNHLTISMRLNPTNPDTDGDGVKDGAETYTTNIYSGHKFFKDDPEEDKIHWYDDLDGDGLINALDPDSDGDNITDGVEVSKYKVKIFMVDAEGKNDDSFVYVSYRTGDSLGIRGLDPTDILNRKLDSDGDNLQDYKENNATHYFPDYTADMSEDEINAQFNPFVTENIPPRIYNLDIDEDEDWGVIYKTINYGLGSKKVPCGYFLKHVWVEVEGDVFDISGVNSVTIVVDNELRESITELETTDEYTYHFKTDDKSLDVLDAISIKRYFLGSYTIKIIAEDGAGNLASLEVEQKSIIASLADAFLDLMGEMWNAAVDTALALGSMMYDWIVGEIKALFQPVIDRIAPPLISYIDGIIDAFVDLVKEIHDFDWGGSSDMPKNFGVGSELFDVMKTGAVFVSSYLGLQEYAEKFMNLLKEIMEFIEPFATLINPMKVIEILLAKLPGSVGEMINTILGIANNAISIMTTTIGSLIFGGENSLLSLLGLSGKTILFPDINNALTNIATALNIPILTAIFMGLDDIPPKPIPNPVPGDPDNNPPDEVIDYSKPQSVASICIIFAKVVITAVFLKVAKDNIKDFLFGGKAFSKALGTARVNTESSTVGKIIGYLLMGLTAFGTIASYAAMIIKGYDEATNERHNLKWGALILHLFSWATHVLGLGFILKYNEMARTSKEFWSAEGLLIGFQVAESAYLALTW